MKRVRYTSKTDPRYLRLLGTSRAWKRRNRNNPEYKRRKAKQDLRFYLEVRNTPSFRRKRLEIKRKYSSDPKIAAKERRRIRVFLKKHPERMKAYGKVLYAVKTGKLRKPKRCQSCHRVPKPRFDGRSGLQAHHHDYRKPLDVRWLCGFCHAALRRRY